jgi:cell division septal protein FtsQ
VSPPRAADPEEATDGAIKVELPPPRRGLFRRRRNRRLTVSRPAVAVVSTWVTDAARVVAAKLLVAGKVLAILAFVAASALGGRQLVRHVVASPRFAVREIRVADTEHVTGDELRELSGVAPGDRLLAIDPDAVAARIASHPWIATARVRRELPSVLAVEVTERRAVATAMLGALYLLDAEGHPFKRATFEEADGLPVITGLTREQYAGLRGASESAFREALALLATYTEPEAAAPGDHPRRPALSEVHIDPRAGFTLVLLDGGGRVLLGRDGFEDKLARLDRMLGALGPRGAAALATVYLDGPAADRVTVRLNPPLAVAAPEPPATSGGKKFRGPAKRGED